MQCGPRSREGATTGTAGRTGGAGAPVRGQPGPIREALKVLQGEGQVTHHPHRRYFVTDLSVDNMAETYRIRSLLETEVAVTAVLQRLARSSANP